MCIFLRNLGVVISLALFSFSVSKANATTFASRAAFELANPGLDTIDFEGIAPGNTTIGGQEGTFAGQGVTFSGGNSGDVTIADSGAGIVVSDALFINNADLTITIEFSPDFSAVGFEVGLFPGASTVNVTVFDALSNQIAAETFLASSSAVLDTFIGFSDLSSDIDRVVVDANGLTLNDGFVLFIDNLSFGGTTATVAEPGALAMFGMGLLGLGLISVRRRKLS